MGYGLNYAALMVGRCVVLGFALLMVGRSWSGFCSFDGTRLFWRNHLYRSPRLFKLPTWALYQHWNFTRLCGELVVSKIAFEAWMEIDVWYCSRSFTCFDYGHFRNAGVFEMVGGESPFGKSKEIFGTSFI